MNIRLMTHDDIPLVEKLRMAAYENATGSKIPDTSFLRWSKNDEQSIILVLENEEKEIISTMQGNVICTNVEVERFFDITLNTAIPLPVFTIGRVATLLKHRRLGYSAVMRALCLKACLLSPKIQGIASTIQADASRVPALRQLGYHIEKADISHRTNSSYQNTSDTLFGLLTKQRFSSAIDIAHTKLLTPLSAFNIDGELMPAMKRKIDALC